MCKFRISNHKLDIELGRHKSPPIPAHQRICSKCNAGVVGDEIHFLLECGATEVLRNDYLGEKTNDTEWTQLSSIEKFIQLMKLENAKEVAQVAGILKEAM